MKIKLHLNQKLKPQQNLFLTLAIQQALKVLQLPIMELAAWVELQIEENPLLQRIETPSDETATELDFNTQGFEVLDHLDENFSDAVFPESSENLVSSEPPAFVSLYSHLMAQAETAFSSPADLAYAEQIIGHLDERGFLTDFSPRMEILAKIQEFDPPGIAARNLQECLLLQLQEGSMAHTFVRDHFHDLLEGICPKTVRKELAGLDFYPGAKFQSHTVPATTPDIILEPTDSGLQILINEEPLPRFELMNSPELPHFYRAGKWVEKVLARRRHILTEMMQILLKKHPEFFLENGVPNPYSLEKMAKELGLHTSTVARAVKDKYLACPRGIFPLKEFFPYSHAKSKKLLKELIADEDKQKPLSDLSLMRLMTEAGIPCARRTVAKYRRLLKIPAASQRRRVIE